MSNIMKVEQPRIIGKDEKWFKWDPGINGLSGKYHLSRLVDKMNTIDVYLSHKTTNQKIKATFNHTWAHRNTYETFRMFLISDLFDLYGDKFYVEWSFFRVENSSYMKWLSVESAGLSDNLTHFVVMGIDFIVDIVAYEEPKIKIYK